MAEKDKKLQNSIHMTGYLSENNLEQVEQTKNEAVSKVIRGSIVIATEEASNYKVTFYVTEYTKNGDASEDFKTLLGLLPENTTSIASYLKSNPGASYEEAKKNATKVWALGKLEEFASAVGENVRSMVLFKGFRAGIKQETEESPFRPHAEFTVDMYVNKIKEEREYADEDDEEGTPTGRYIIQGLIPAYGGIVYAIDFIAPVENGIADFFASTYKEGDTGTFKGNLVNISKKELKEDSEDEEEFFGEPRGPQYRTIFVRERVITGLSKKPLHQGDKGCITTSDIKKALTEREKKMAENGKRDAEKAKREEQAKAPASSKADFSEDMDF